MSYRKELTFGLDIGDRSLKVLQLHHRRSTIERSAFSEFELTGGLTKDGTILNEEALSMAIKEAVRLARVQARNVISALPEARTFLKLLLLQKQGETPLRELIAQGLERHIPFSLDEIWWDFRIVSEQETSFSALVGAAPKALVAAYCNLLLRAGLTPVSLDLEPLACTRALMNASYNGQCVLIADLGATKSTLMTATPETILFTADGGISGDALTALIASSLAIDASVAEEMKKKYGLSKEGAPPAYHTVLNNYGVQLADTIKRMIHFSAETFPLFPPVSLVLLTGGSALLKELPQYLTNALTIKVMVGNPWSTIQSQHRPDLPAESALRFTTVCGLALTALNFEHR